MYFINQKLETFYNYSEAKAKSLNMRKKIYLFEVDKTNLALL